MTMTHKADWWMVAIGLTSIAMASCSSPPIREVPQEAPGTHTRCEDPRPEICTREYRPVCAQRDTGIRCVTTPCDSVEAATYSNACTACSDPKVTAHRPGACAANDGGLRSSGREQ